MENSVFLYGTLSFDEIISALLARKTKGIPAKIHGYARIRVSGKRYPGLVKASGDSAVSGNIHQDITQEELDLLNTFEDDFYKLITADIELGDGKHTEALTYIIPEENLVYASSEEWDREYFSKKYHEDYIKMVKGFRRSYLAGRRKSQEF